MMIYDDKFWLKREVDPSVKLSLFNFIHQYEYYNNLTFQLKIMFMSFICSSYSVDRKSRYSVSYLALELKNNKIKLDNVKYLLTMYMDSLQVLAIYNNKRDFII